VSFSIGPYQFDNPLVLAPMAGVTDRPFRQLCRKFGAGMTVSEMVNSNPDLRYTRKSLLRRDHRGEPEPIIVQISGSEADQMAEAARFNVDQGAQIIDINMGCPAKKVCRKEAGSALMRDPVKVAQILKAVVTAVNVPVTLKTRTGWSTENRNIQQIARIAEDCGIQALTIHGRTRDQKYDGEAEYQSIRSIKKQLNIPVIANGDINNAKKAKMVMDFTEADAIMIGRAAQSRPWIFQQINQYLENGHPGEEPELKIIKKWLIQHLENLYRFYGEFQGTRIARKHIIWQLGDRPGFLSVKTNLLGCETARRQLGLINKYFDCLQSRQFDKTG
jgi:tRNA-dihydrouridine synthase B